VVDVVDVVDVVVFGVVCGVTVVTGAGWEIMGVLVVVVGVKSVSFIEFAGVGAGAGETVAGVEITTGV